VKHDMNAVATVIQAHGESIFACRSCFILAGEIGAGRRVGNLRARAPPARAAI